MVEILSSQVAGMFYSSDAEELKSMIGQFLCGADENLPTPKAMIVPHAGYIYSGAIAAKAYACLGKARKKIKRVVMLGPGHRFPVTIATADFSSMQTPFGIVPVDKNTVNKALSLNQVKVVDDAFFGEHCLEVQLPFLQTLLNDFSVAPFLVGDADYHDVAELIELLWGGEETLIVVSSDLSHFYDYANAKKLDSDIANAILELSPEKIHSKLACGHIIIQGLLIAAKNKGLTAKLIELKNSGDTAGPKDKVVGYGAFHFLEA